MIPRGYLYVFGCASSFGLITTLAKLTYDEGASPQTVVFFRILAGSLMMGVWSAYSHRTNPIYVIRNSLQSTNLPIVFLIIAIGFCIPGVSLGFLRSLKYIPLTLSAFLFFTFPFWVLLLNFIIHGIVVSWIKLFAFVLAFSGLALSLGPTWEVLDWRGIALVLGGSIFSAGMIVGATKASQIISMSDLVFLSNTIGVILVGLIVFFTDSFSLTQTTWVWSVIATICILFVFGQLCLFAATKTIGSAQTSLMLNIEPLVSILAAVILLGESLVLSQTLGVAVILVALVLASATQQGFSFFKKINR